jgi:hypothetical protein
MTEDSPKSKDTHCPLTRDDAGDKRPPAAFRVSPRFEQKTLAERDSGISGGSGDETEAA